MPVCCNQTARKACSGPPLSRLREADLLFGARFFSYRDIEGLLCKINHGRIGMGTELLQFQSFAEALYLCVFLLSAFILCLCHIIIVYRFLLQR